MILVRYKLLFLLFCSICLSAYAKQIAITFDDLPVNRDISIAKLQEITSKLMIGLNKANISVTGFVNEEKLYQKNSDVRVSMLNDWLTHGHQLGNHTYSHVSLHRVTIEDYERQIIDGEKITQQLMAERGLKESYFRHPYLHTGTSNKTRRDINHFLSNHGYEIAPVTYDTDDWRFDRLYVTALQEKNYIKAENISRQYLLHTRNKFNFYDEATQIIFNRDINQIWLLHANSINADNIDVLIEIAKGFGFTFITLKEALADPAYQTRDNYYKDFGVSWLYRWDYSTGLKVNWKKEPEPV